MKCYKLCLWKAYFEKGYSLTNYIKYLIIMLGLYTSITSQTISVAFILAFLYGIACFFIGWAWYHYDIVVAEHEVNNQFNLFMREVRKKIKKQKI